MRDSNCDSCVHSLKRLFQLVVANLRPDLKRVVKQGIDVVCVYSYSV